MSSVRDKQVVSVHQRHCSWSRLTRVYRVPIHDLTHARDPCHRCLFSSVRTPQRYSRRLMQAGKRRRCAQQAIPTRAYRCDVRRRDDRRQGCRSMAAKRNRRPSCPHSAANRSPPSVGTVELRTGAATSPAAASAAALQLEALNAPPLRRADRRVIADQAATRPPAGLKSVLAAEDQVHPGRRSQLTATVVTAGNRVARYSATQRCATAIRRPARTAIATPRVSRAGCGHPAGLRSRQQYTARLPCSSAILASGLA